MSSRKRRAPGASPQVRQHAGSHSNAYGQDIGTVPADQYLNNWNDQSGNADLNMAFNDPSMYSGVNFPSHLSGAAGQSTHNRIVSLDGLDNVADNAASYDGTLVRRNQDHQLAARGQTPWEAFDGDANAGQGWENAEDDDDELEQKALVAKKDAQSKRKQIPPFVQKLSRYVSEYVYHTRS